jgi:23S rRNA pseudouridine1911/1915/1917 synthase
MSSDFTNTASNSIFEAERRSGFHSSILFLKTKVDGVLHILLECHESIGARALELVEFGSVYVNQLREIDPCRKIKAGDLLRVHQSPRRYSVQVEEIDIFYENEHFLILNKPSNLPTHATVDNLKENALHRLQELRKEIYVLNRLDLETRGLLVFAKTKTFQRDFQSLLKSRQILKIYRARVEGNWSFRGLLTHYMVRSFRSPKVLSLNPSPESQICQLEVLDFEYDSQENFSELRIRLITGRSHQIRAQLAFEGHPLQGDTLYGSSGSHPFLLVCEELSWDKVGGSSFHFYINSTNKLKIATK